MSDLTIPPGITTIALLVMDESGSMERFGAAPIQAIERLLAEQRASPFAATTAVGVMTFAETLRVRISIVGVRATSDLPHYEPDGRTKLFACLRDLIAPLRGLALPKEVVVATFTDGEDNRSSGESLLELRRHAADARADGWTFLTFGFGVDAAELARTMGFPDDPAHARTMGASAASVHRSVEYASRITSMRASHAPR